MPKEIKELAEKYPEVNKYVDELNYIHDSLIKALGKDFLSSLGIKEVSFREILKTTLLPKVSVKSQPLNEEELVSISLLLKNASIYPQEPI